MAQTTNDMRQMTLRGRQIEEDSFAIIDKEAGAHGFPPDEWQVVRRVIHATADFEFLSLLQFHDRAVESGIEALRSGQPLIVDVKMIASGLNEDRLSAYGCRIENFISDADVIAAAKENNSTRAREAMRKAHRTGKLNGAIVAVGNAPTALLEVVRLIEVENARPSLLIGVPVGFVGAADAKEQVVRLSKIPYIVAQGRKGGSAIAVAVIHALLLLSAGSAA